MARSTPFAASQSLTKRLGTSKKPGQMVGKIAAMLASAHCERVRGFHPEQYGCRTGRSAVDAGGVTIAQVQEAWGRGCVVGALLMEVAAAFPSVARGCLLKMMRRVGIDECLVRVTDSFMRDRREIMSVDGQDGKPMDVTTGLPQGSPISLALHAIYIADIHETVEDQVEDCRGISYVDDLTWAVEGSNVDVVSKLQRCAQASLEWADNNAVRFEETKTDAILFSNRRKHRQCRRQVRVGSTLRVGFASEATRCLGLWLDTSLNLK